MSAQQIEIRVERHNWAVDGVSVLIRQPGWKHGRAVVQDLKFAIVEDGGHIEDSAILSNEAAQALLNQLWVLGYRPNDGTGSTGELQATQFHLKDMRSIAFANLGLKDCT